LWGLCFRGIGWCPLSETGTVPGVFFKLCWSLRETVLFSFFFLEKKETKIQGCIKKAKIFSFRYSEQCSGRR